ncbi:hypothetical protein SNE40_017168 [Patella caerulea]|uniref:TMEM205-like domain-containing protein n=1 Tax=Patella caerulea TaxID=87958 RepID=A0AAN8JAK4_PATCE
MAVLNMDKIRVGQIQYLAVMVMVIFLSFILFPGRRRVEPTSTFLTLVHLGTFAAQYGAQLWVTLVAGITMFCSLPRRMFGQVQKRLFPMFFFWCLLTSAIVTATHILRHPVETWSYSQYVAIYALSAGFISAAVNSIILSPLIVSAMLKTFQMEVEAGVGDIVGYANVPELKKNPEYVNSYRTFRRCHGASACLTVVSLAANTVHLYYLACQLVPGLI